MDGKKRWNPNSRQNIDTSRQHLPDTFIPGHFAYLCFLRITHIRSVTSQRERIPPLLLQATCFAPPPLKNLTSLLGDGCKQRANCAASVVKFGEISLHASTERRLLLPATLTGAAVFISVAGRTEEFASGGLAWNKVHKDGGGARAAAAKQTDGHTCLRRWHESNGRRAQSGGAHECERQSGPDQMCRGRERCHSA